MKALNALTLAVALTLPMAIPAVAQEALPPMINVTGTGTVEAAPDIATLSIGVTTQGDTAAAALAANTAALDAVLVRLTAAGIAPADMQTSNLSLNPNWTGYDNNNPVISSYVASNVLTITIRKLDSLGAVLDASVADGANTLNGLIFAVADPEPLLDEARKAAVADARARAELLAEAAGVKLGKIVSITEMTTGAPPMPMYKAELSAAPVPVVGGEVEMSASIMIFYEIVE
jgi:uncharacterized protein YggE